MTAMSWRGRQRWAEPTKMSDFLLLPLTTQLEIKKVNIVRNLRDYNKTQTKITCEIQSNSIITETLLKKHGNTQSSHSEFVLFTCITNGQ